MLTGFYAGCLVIIFLNLTLQVIKGRREHQIAYGYGENHEIAGIVSAHSNFVAYVPLFLILLFSIELGQPDIPHLYLHVVATSFVLGRLFHARGLSKSEKSKNFGPRKLGMHLTIWPILALALANMLFYFL